MRMWNVDPKLLCRKHLLGEHVEIHMLVGSILKGINLSGYTDTGLVELHTINVRHDQLVTEMKRRKYNHKSPLPKFRAKKLGKVDSRRSLRELAQRCPECKKRQAGTRKATGAKGGN